MLSPDSPSKEIVISNQSNVRWEVKSTTATQFAGESTMVFLLAPCPKMLAYALKWRIASPTILRKDPTAPCVSHCSSHPASIVLKISPRLAQRESP